MGKEGRGKLGEQKRYSCYRVLRTEKKTKFILSMHRYYFYTIFSVFNEFPKMSNDLRSMKRLWSDQSLEKFATEELKLENSSTKNHICFVIHDRDQGRR